MSADTIRHGFAIGPAGVEATALPAQAIASLSAFKGQRAALTALFEEDYRLSLPTTPAVSRGDQAVSAVGLGPDRWLILAEGQDHRFIASLKARVAGRAAVADQSDAYCAYRLAGPDLRRTLAKGVPLDLHPEAFPVGAAATTIVAHVGIALWRPDDDSVIMIVSRSYDGSFRHWLLESAAEFGLMLTPAAGSAAHRG